MSPQTAPPGGAAGYSASREAVIEAIRSVIPQKEPILEFRRRPSRYRSTFRIEEIRIGLAGRTLDVLFKDVSRRSLPEGLRQAKPAFLHDPMREIRTYQLLLNGAGLGTPQMYGAVADAAGHRYWLFIERVEGPVLTEIGDLGCWKTVARWLARMHAALGPRTASRAGACRLLKHDGDFYRRWMRRAVAFATPRRRSALEGLSRYHDLVVENLLSQPVTFIHGEFYASNVLLGEGRVCPVDWEMAALGPALTDLAALVAGDWSEAERGELISAYREARERSGHREKTPEFSRRLACCRFQLCMQWLGWSRNWKPPRMHAHDWLEEALHLTAELES